MSKKLRKDSVTTATIGLVVILKLYLEKSFNILNTDQLDLVNVNKYVM